MNVPRISADAVRVDLASLIESAPFVGVPLFVTLLSFVIMTIDGYDLQAMAFAAPAIATQWAVKRELLGPVLAASIVGMAFGSIGFGRLGDRIGRKAALAACIALLGVGSLACAYAADLNELVMYRVVTGFGLGGAAPLATALITEWTSIRWRSVAVALVIVGVPLGGTLGAALAARIISAFGWQAVFFVGAGLPLLLLAVVLLRLPESPKFLALSPQSGPRLAKSLNRLLKQERFTGGECFVVEEAPRRVSGWFLTLLRPPYLSTTLIIWSAFACNSLALYSFVNWLPTVLSSSGMPIPQALHGSLLFNLGGILGAVGGSALIFRFGSRRIGSLIASAGAVAACLIGLTVIHGAYGQEARLGLLVFIAVAGVALNGLQIFLYAVSAHSYPTEIRASGVGCASAMARVGGVLSSVVGSAVYSLGVSSAQFFYVIAGVIVLATMSFYGLRTHIPPRRLQPRAGA
jgi:MFS transporter, AAHS family, 4-hydroxybenzoate transporter